MQRLTAVIVGAGFGGLCMGIKLKQAGYDEFVILEKAEDLGGTWRENIYPGAECDIPSALYSYSFEHNSDWEFVWSGQEQILKYQHDTAIKYGLMSHIRYQQSVTSAVFDDDAKTWLIRTESGDEYRTQHFISAVGQLHHPSTPSIEGDVLFNGPRFHSARWDHSVDLANKRVGVVGNAASAVQFIPEIAKVARSVTVFQRSPNWIMPKLDRAYSGWEQRLSAGVPLITKLYRWSIWATGEYGVFKAIKGNRLARWLVRKLCLRNLQKNVSDPELRAKLLPDYPVGAKRVLFSDHYYPALTRENVHLETSGIEAFTESGINSRDGAEHACDVIIYGTGFKTNPFLLGIDVFGDNKQRLHDVWQGGAQAYLGVSVSGFPNMHLLYGPNTNLGHTSIIIMLEAQADYIIQMMRYLDDNDVVSCSVKAIAEQRYNSDLQQRLGKLAFSDIEQSWYKDGDKITNNWAGGTREYEKRLQRVDWSQYELYR